MKIPQTFWLNLIGIISALLVAALNFALYRYLRLRRLNKASNAAIAGGSQVQFLIPVSNTTLGGAFPNLVGYTSEKVVEASKILRSFHRDAILFQINALANLVIGYVMGPAALLFALLSSLNSIDSAWRVVFQGAAFGSTLAVVLAYWLDRKWTTEWIRARFSWLNACQRGWLGYLGLTDSRMIEALDELQQKGKNVSFYDGPGHDMQQQSGLQQLFGKIILSRHSVKPNSAAGDKEEEREAWIRLLETYYQFRLKDQFIQFSKSRDEQERLAKGFESLSTALFWMGLVCAIAVVFGALWTVERGLEPLKDGLEATGLLLVPTGLILSAYVRAHGWQPNALNYRLSGTALEDICQRFQEEMNELRNLAADLKVATQAAGSSKTTPDQTTLNEFVGRVGSLRMLAVDAELILHMEFRSWLVLRQQTVRLEP